MALRDQPYLPLYVDDYLTDEKLNMCSAATQGVYIKILCLMHKSEPYGHILLKQKDKQSVKQLENFACKLARLLPFQTYEIEAALTDLIEEEVIQLEGDSIVQKRMVKDNSISVSRSKAGTKGGESTQSKLKTFAKAKRKANSVNVNVNENEITVLSNKVYFENSELNDVFERWLKMLDERQKPMTQSSIEALQMKLNRQSVEYSIKQIEQSLEKNWLNLRAIEITEAKEETAEETNARIFMETVKDYNTHKTLYGEESANEKFKHTFNVQPNIDNNRLA